MTEHINDIVVTDNPDAQQYEANVNGYLGVAQYQRHGNRITFTHTEVPSELNGMGVGSKLAQTALDEARAQHLEVVPLCPFIASYIRRHQEYAALVPAAYQDRVKAE